MSRAGLARLDAVVHRGGVNSEVTTSIELSPGELGTSLCALRLCVPEAQEKMQQSLAKLGQLQPVHAWRMGSQLELFDGIKRQRAALDLSWPQLRVEVHALDALGAKVRLWRINSSAGLSELEKAWVVRSLYRDEKLTQPQIARLLGHDKSWVCRRLALAEELSDELTCSVRLGLVSPTICREVVRLPRGNQEAVAHFVSRRGLTTRQTKCLVDRLLGAAQEQWPKILEQGSAPREPKGPPKGGALRRTPAEQLMADAWAMKRLAARMHARLLERSLASLGEPAQTTVSGELIEVQRTLLALTTTLALRLEAQGGPDAAKA